MTSYLRIHKIALNLSINIQEKYILEILVIKIVEI